MLCWQSKSKNGTEKYLTRLRATSIPLLVDVPSLKNALRQCYTEYINGFLVCIFQKYLIDLIFRKSDETGMRSNVHVGSVIRLRSHHHGEQRSRRSRYPSSHQQKQTNSSDLFSSWLADHLDNHQYKGHLSLPRQKGNLLKVQLNLIPFFMNSLVSGL